MIKLLIWVKKDQIDFLVWRRSIWAFWAPSCYLLWHQGHPRAPWRAWAAPGLHSVSSGLFPGSLPWASFPPLCRRLPYQYRPATISGTFWLGTVSAFLSGSHQILLTNYVHIIEKAIARVNVPPVTKCRFAYFIMALKDHYQFSFVEHLLSQPHEETQKSLLLVPNSFQLYGFVKDHVYFNHLKLYYLQAHLKS